MRRWLLPIGLVLVLLNAGCAALRGGDGPAETGGRQAAELNTQLGIGYLERGRFDLAKDRLEKAMRQDESFAPAYHAYALLMDRLGEADAAAGNFNKALELAPADPELRNNHGGFLCRQKRLDEALAEFDKAAGDPLYATPEYALTNAGICLREAGQPARAEPYLNAALQRNPRFPSAIYQMAVTRQALGDAAGALKWLELLHERHGYTPESLRLGWQVARALGDSNAAGRFELLFRARYPDQQLESAPGPSAAPPPARPG